MIAVPQEGGNGQEGFPEESFRLEMKIQSWAQLSWSSMCALRTFPAKHPHPTELRGRKPPGKQGWEGAGCWDETMRLHPIGMWAVGLVFTQSILLVCSPGAGQGLGNPLPGSRHAVSLGPCISLVSEGGGSCFTPWLPPASPQRCTEQAKCSSMGLTAEGHRVCPVY